MEIQHRQTDGGEFFIMEENKKIANLEYVMESKVMIITHTMVAGAKEGQGIGRRLVEAAVNFARENTIKIHPVCPFAAAVLRKNESFKDIRAKA